MFLTPTISKTLTRRAAIANDLRPAMMSSYSSSSFLHPPRRSFVSSKSTTDSSTTTTLNKADLAKTISEEHDLSVAASTRILDTVLDQIVEAVAEKKRVRLAGFGAFYSMTSKERTGRNPSTGASITIPAQERVKFKAYDSFKTIVKK